MSVLIDIGSIYFWVLRHKEILKMAFLAKHVKCDLKTLAADLGETFLDSVTVVELRQIITGSKSYDEEFVRELLETIKRTRVEEEQTRLEEKKMEFELEKLRIEKGVAASGSNAAETRAIPVDLSRHMPRFDMKDGDIILYLSLFERQAKRAAVAKEGWVSSLLTLLPPDIVELIARMSEEEFQDYEAVKKMLLKRFRMSPEGFRQKYVQHQRAPEKSWKDFAYEVTNYFQGWIEGLEVNDFEGLRNLMITDQMKRKVPQEIREHFIDEWSTILTPSELANKVDEFESCRRTFRKPGSGPPKAQSQQNNKFRRQDNKWNNDIRNTHNFASGTSVNRRVPNVSHFYIFT